MDIIQLYQDFSVDYKTEGHRHCRPGWVNVPCPYCTGNPGYHLGFDTTTNGYVCWRCGWHPVIPTIAKLIHLTEAETRPLIKQYGLLIKRAAPEANVKIRVKAHKLPTGTGPLQENHKRYLEFRNFDPETLEKVWNLMGTGPVSKLDGIDYKHRIIIPFLWNNQQVSFDSRDITGKDPGRYKACPKDRELIPHKEIIYGVQKFWKESGICVEGPTDCWRLGVHSFAVSGIKYTAKQVDCIAKLFKRVAVVFDDDPQAKVQALKLITQLKYHNVDAFFVGIDGDPGSMSQSEADYLVKQLI